MTTAKTIRVSRERLIARLKERQAEHEANRSRLFREAVDAEIRKAKREAETATRRVARLEKAKTPADLPDEYFARRFDKADDLAQHIRLLELSDDDTITVGPTHDLFRWL